jgi:hypothetical protein
LFACDGFTQFLFSEEGDTYDFRRGLSMAIWGVVWYGGPQQWFWVSLYPRVFPGSTLTSAMGRTFLDCGVNVCCVLIPLFYVVTGTVKGYTLEKSVSILQSQYWDACFGLVAFWVPIVFATMLFFPPHLQSYPIQCAQVINKSWLSWFGNKCRVEERRADAGTKLSVSVNTPRLQASVTLPVVSMMAA